MERYAPSVFFSIKFTYKEIPCAIFAEVRDWRLSRSDDYNGNTKRDPSSILLQGHTFPNGTALSWDESSLNTCCIQWYTKDNPSEQEIYDLFNKVEQSIFNNVDAHLKYSKGQ